MHRVLIAVVALSWLTPLDGIAQDFQFMPFAPRAKKSLMPFPTNWGIWFGYVVEGDMNGDGRSDLVASFNHTDAAVFSGTATGWIAPTTWFRWALQKPVLVDLDGDGDRDLVGVPPYLLYERPVLVYANTPNGMTAVTLPWPADTLVQGVAVGDVDADGFADLVIATRPGSVTPSLVLARGGPGLQFTANVTSMPTGLPYALWPELLDVDGDGDLDVLATNATSGMRFLRNVGGSFVDATSSLPPIRGGQHWTRACDLDGDGHPDCAATTAGGVVDMLWGAPGGPTFAAAVATVPGVLGLDPGDFDGDGDLDLLAEHSGGLDVLWNQGNRQFARTNILAQRTSLHGVVDVDLDGRHDVVFSIWDESYLRCLYQATVEDAAFALGFAPSPSGPRGASVAGDVDGDGRTDLVTAGPSLISVEHAVGGGVYRRSTSQLANLVSGSWRTELADMDGDADLDLVAKDVTQVSVVTNNGTGTFTSRSLARASPGFAVDDLRIADIDADGDLDLVLAEGLGVALIRNLGGGQYAPTATIMPAAPPRTQPVQSQRCVEVADVDGDGDVDVIGGVLAASGTTHVIAANDGTGNFAPHASFSVYLGAAPISVRAGDIDADGDADLFVADNQLRVLRNNGSGAFTDTSLMDLPANMDGIGSNLVVADLDEDGDLDVSALRLLGTASLVLLLNDGSGRFTFASGQRVAPGSVSWVWLLRACDVDDDDDLDVIAGTIDQQFVLANHLRQCRSNIAPRLGGVADLHLLSGPNFGAPGLGLLVAGFALATPPVQLSGLAGRLELDPTTMQVMAAVTTSSIGVSSAFAPVPQDAALFGLEVWFQGAILPSVGRVGFTNAVYEVVLR